MEKLGHDSTIDQQIDFLVDKVNEIIDWINIAEEKQIQALNILEGFRKNARFKAGNSS